MPVVPRYSGAQVAPTNLPSVQLGAYDTGQDAVARGVTALSGAAAQWAQQEREKADNAALLDFENRLAQTETDLLHDPEAGVYAKRGRDTFEVQEQVWPQWDSRVGEARGALPPRLHARAEQLAARRRQDAQRGIARHLMQETERYAQQQEDGLLASAQHAASLNYLDPDRVDTEAARALLAAQVRADRLGLDGLARSEAMRTAASSVYATTIERMLVDDPFEAQGYFERWGDKLTPEARLATQRALYPVIEDMAADSTYAAWKAGQFVEADDPQVIDAAIVQLESAGRADAKNPESSATGAGQFIESTWLDMVRRHRPELAAGKDRAEILAMRTDPDLSREMVGAYRRDNAAHLQAQGVQTTAANLYAAHHFGPAGGVKFGQANNDTPMSAILTAGQLNANGYLKGKTKGEAIANWQRRGLPAGSAAPQVASGGAPRTEADAIQYARDHIRDKRLQSAFIRKAREDFALQDMREREQNKANFEGIYTALETAENPNRPLREIIGADAYAWAVREGRVDQFENARMRKVQGTFVQDDPVLVDALSREAVLSPNTFKDRNLYEVIDRLSTDSLQSFLKMQQDANKPGAQADWSTADERLNRGFVMVGIGRDGDARGSGAAKKNEDRDRMRGEFRIAYNDAERAWIQSNGGKKPTPEVSDALLRSVARTFAERQAEGRTAIYRTGTQYDLEIAPAERAAVVDAYRQKYGVAPTDAWVTNYIGRFRAEQQPGVRGE